MLCQTVSDEGESKLHSPHNPVDALFARVQGSALASVSVVLNCLILVPTAGNMHVFGDVMWCVCVWLMLVNCCQQSCGVMDDVSAISCDLTA